MPCIFFIVIDFLPREGKWWKFLSYGQKIFSYFSILREDKYLLTFFLQISKVTSVQKIQL